MPRPPSSSTIWKRSALSLEENGGHYAARRALAPLIAQARLFGFHLARLDIREHKEKYLGALAAVLAATQGTDWATL